MGPFLLAAAIVGLVLHPIFPMTSHGMEPSVTDTMHIILTGASQRLRPRGGGPGRHCYRGWFRRYSIGTLLVLIAPDQRPQPDHELDGAVEALKTTIEGVDGNSLLSAAPTIVSDLKRIDTAWTALQQQIDQAPASRPVFKVAAEYAAQSVLQPAAGMLERVGMVNRRPLGPPSRSASSAGSASHIGR